MNEEEFKNTEPQFREDILNKLFISKQKVKEVLDKWKDNNLMEYEEIYKELGLE